MAKKLEIYIFIEPKIYNGYYIKQQKKINNYFFLFLFKTLNTKLKKAILIVKKKYTLLFFIYTFYN